MKTVQFNAGKQVKKYISLIATITTILIRRLTDSGCSYEDAIGAVCRFPATSMVGNFCAGCNYLARIHVCKGMEPMFFPVNRRGEVGPLFLSEIEAHDFMRERGDQSWVKYELDKIFRENEIPPGKKYADIRAEVGAYYTMP